MLNTDALFVLATFAAYIPVLAVRRRSPDLIGQGLTALALIGNREDFRDLTFSLATLYHSATRLGIDTGKLFAEVAALVPPGLLADAMRLFLPRLALENRDRFALSICGRRLLTVSSTSCPLRRLHGAVPFPEHGVDYEADDQPEEEADPGQQRQAHHQQQAAGD